MKAFNNAGLSWLDSSAQLCIMEPSVSGLLKAFCAFRVCQQHGEVASWVWLMQIRCVSVWWWVFLCAGRTIGIQTCAFTYSVNAGSSAVARHVMRGRKRETELQFLWYFHNMTHAAQSYWQDSQYACNEKCFGCGRWLCHISLCKPPPQTLFIFPLT